MTSFIEQITSSVTAFQIQKNKPVVADNSIRQHIFCHFQPNEFSPTSALCEGKKGYKRQKKSVLHCILRLLTFELKKWPQFIWERWEWMKTFDTNILFVMEM